MRAFKRVVVVSLAAALGTALFSYREKAAAAAEAASQLQELERRAEELSPIRSRIGAYQRSKAIRENKAAVIDWLRYHPPTTPVVQPDVLHRLSLAMPSSVKIERMDIRGPSLAVSGRAETAESLETWGQDLRDDRLLGEFELRGFEPRADRAPGTFNVAGRLNPPPFPPPGTERLSSALHPSEIEGWSEVE